MQAGVLRVLRRGAQITSNPMQPHWTIQILRADNTRLDAGTTHQSSSRCTSKVSIHLHRREKWSCAVPLLGLDLGRQTRGMAELRPP